MKRNNFFSRFIVVTLTAALLLISGSRAIRVSALAEIAPDIAPVFDTQIYQLQDYIDNGGLTSDQLDIFYILSGAVLASMNAGASEYKLEDPFTTEDGLFGWLKSCGIQLYNTAIDLHLIGIDPVTGVDNRKWTGATIDLLFGISQEAAKYHDVNDFKEHIADQNTFFVPLTADIQSSLQYAIGKNGGLYYWQQTEGQYTSPFTWRYVQMNNVQGASYNQYLQDVALPRAFCNSSNGHYCNSVTPQWKTFDLFIDTDQYFIQLYDENGQAMYGSFYTLPKVLNYIHYYDGFGYLTESVEYQYAMNAFCYTLNYTAANFDTFADVAQYAYNNFNSLFYMRDQNYSSYYYYFDPLAFINKVYYGVDWQNRSEVVYTTDLNFAENSNQYYNRVQDQYLLDIKGLLSSLLNTTDLYLPFINNIYDLEGNSVVPILLHISNQIDDIIQTVNVPIPVNLNDIAELTDNTYLERVKEHAHNAGDIFANYVAFWYNCDQDLVYTVFGAAILVLVGAFVGKWGHS